MFAVAIPDEFAIALLVFTLTAVLALFSWVLTQVVKLAGMVAVIVERLDGHDDDHAGVARRLDRLERHRWRQASYPMGEGHP